MDNINKTWVLSCLLLCFIVGGLTEQCGRQAGGALCPGGLCCSQFGWCGDTCDYCGRGCQSQCGSSPCPSGGLADIISSDTFNQMLMHRDDAAFPARGFYTYDAFIQTGTKPSKRLLNYNYGPAGGAIGVDLLNNPDLVASDPVISFKTALWFWMTPQSPKPSCHDVITGRWTPSDADRAAGRLPGYGTVTNIINGGLECGRGQDSRVADRIGFFMRYCDIFGVGYGDNLDCYSQTPFSPSSLIDVI